MATNQNYPHFLQNAPCGEDLFEGKITQSYCKKHKEAYIVQ